LLLSANHGFDILLVDNTSEALNKDLGCRVILKTLEASGLGFGRSLSPGHLLPRLIVRQDMVTDIAAARKSPGKVVGMWGSSAFRMRLVYIAALLSCLY
jgi:hypothetical protein